jgi:glycosyltransferase involved in cell wall biosynthesis
MRAQTRIYFVNRYFYPDESATSQLLSDLAFGLAGAGQQVHIVCSRQLYGDPRSSLPAREVVRGVTVHRLWTTRFGRQALAGRALDYLSFYAAAAFSLLGRLRRNDIVVAETDPPLISLVAAVAAGLKGAVLVNWLQDVFPEIASELGANPLPPALDRLLRSCRDRSLRAAACNVVLGSRMREYVQTRVPPAVRIEIIENWADPDELRPLRVADSRLRQRCGLGEQFVVGYSGNLGRAHEIDTLLGAAVALREDAGVRFLFIGGGTRMEELKLRVAALGLASFQFLPYQPRAELADSLAAPDVHLASLNPALEGLIVPSKLYGVLAAARPLIFIGDPDGELARVLRASGCGLVANAGDPQGLVTAIQRLRADPLLREAMGTAARATLCERYAASRALTAWHRLLQGLTN